MLIGLNLAAASTSASGRISLSAYGVGDLVVLLSPLLVVIAAMFIPLLDLVMAVIRRTRAGVSPFTPDKMHLHHRLLRVGHSQRRSVLIIYLWVGWLTTAAVTPMLVPWQVYFPLIILLALVVAIMTYLPRVQQRWVGPRVRQEVSPSLSRRSATVRPQPAVRRSPAPHLPHRVRTRNDQRTLREEPTNE